MKFHSRLQEEPFINLTSLIDVVFLLLLFFMVSTTFERAAALKIDLPEASEVENLAAAPDRLEMVIAADGRMYLNDQQLADDRVETITAAFKQEAGSDRTLPLLLRADRETPHHFVVTAMDVAAQLGFTNLSIATVRADGNPE